MGSKRKLAKIINDPLEYSDDAIDHADADITTSTVSSSKAGGKNSITALQDDSTAAMLRRSFAVGLNSSTVHHFPDLLLGNDKYVSASFHMTPGKTVFSFRVGRNIEGNDSIVHLSEEGVDKLLEMSPRFLKYLDQWDALKKASEEEADFDITGKPLPEPPISVVLDDPIFPLELGVFKYKETFGGGVALRSLRRNKVPFETSGGEDKRFGNKPFGMTGPNFRNLVNVHIPFFRSVYDEITKMIETVKRKEGVTSREGGKVTTWRNC